MTSSPNKLVELARLFIKLGFIGFGGPAAHIALLEQEVVTRLGWMDREHFMDLLGVTHLIPGPNSTEMALHVGYHRAGYLGLLVAGTCFILPAALLTLIFAWLYVEYGTLPEAGPWLYGIKPAVLAVMFYATLKLSKVALKGSRSLPLCIMVILASIGQFNEILILFVATLIGAWWLKKDSVKPKQFNISAAPWFILPSVATLTVTVSNTGPTLLKLFLFFLKVGAVLYGSGYVLVAFLEGDLVTRLAWLTQEQLLDAVALGQLTPGPVLTTATFIGFQLAGWWGALAGTVAIFLPAFVFILFLSPLITRVRENPKVRLLLNAVNVAALGLLIAVLIKLSRNTLVEWEAALITVLAVAVVLRFKKLNPAWLVVGGAVGGYLLTGL